MNNKQQAETALKQLADQYVNFNIEGKKVPIPYILNKGRWRFWKSVGKGNPETIRRELYQQAEYEQFDLENASAFDIYSFMREKRIGIDCSGLAYHLLDSYLQAISSVRLKEVLIKKPGIIGSVEKTLLRFKRERRINVATLASELNSIAISTIDDIQVGDMIRLSKERDHVLIVVNRSDSIIEYVHSSNMTKKQGPHFATISLVNSNNGLEHQIWSESLKNGLNYGKEMYHPEIGDGVRRLKIMNSINNR